MFGSRDEILSAQAKESCDRGRRKMDQPAEFETPGGLKLETLTTEKLQESLAADRVTPNRLRVLLLEDNPDDAQLIQLMLEDAGNGLFEIETVERLERALQRLQRGGVGLVLSDLSLPDSHGLQTFMKLQAQARHVPIIVLSGLDDTTLAVQAVH